MSHDAFAGIPAPDARCRLTVVVPARNEEAFIERLLSSLAAQRTLSENPIDPAAFDVLVYANSCDDDTAARVRAFAARHDPYRIFVAEETLPPPIAHIGTARKRAMDAAAARYRGFYGGVLAATDADTRPAADWIAQMLDEMTNVDAVMGRIFIERRDWNALPVQTRRMLRDEDAYQLALVRARARLTPDLRECRPSHWQRSGPSFAVRVDAYLRAGGVPPLPVLEDIGLYDALVTTGARIRHSPRVHVWTSGRTISRAYGGFGTRVLDWNAKEAAAELRVEHPLDTLSRLAGHPPLVPRGSVPARVAAALLDRLETPLPRNAA